MASEVLVCDLLCEAMEYLSKLGTNLRARSESLKEKRIRKDKLKNSHAVQKAANKVLLICELSKKSLENVESGVRTVLSKVKDNYQSPSKNNPSPSAPKKQDHYQYLSVLSRTIKIPKKVPLKHYMSVKVLARNMSKSSCDKYPVHYNCKLYRERRRVAKSKSEIAKNNEIESNEEKLNMHEKDRCYMQNESIGSNNSDLDLEKNKHTSQVDNSKDPKFLRNEGNEILINDKKQISHNVSEQGNLQDICDNSNVEIHDTVPVVNKYEHNTKKDNDNNDTDDSHTKNSTAISNDEAVEEEADKMERSDINKKRESISKDVSEGLTDDPKKHLKKKFKHIRIVDDSSENSSEPSCEVQSSKNVVCDQNKDQEQSEIAKKESNNEEAVENEEECKLTRPLIKCVSLNKLLKPDILKKNETMLKECETTSNITKKKENKKYARINSIDKYLSKKKNKDNVDKNNKTKQISEIILSSDDEDYWSQKRKEVSTFKSKKFTVNVTRLPKLTTKFLQVYNLKKVTQNNKIICELSENQISKVSSTDEDNNEITMDKSKNFKQMPSEKLDTVKNSLLNESDSEKSDSNQQPNFEDIVKTVKTALLGFPVVDDVITQEHYTQNNTENQVDKEPQKSQSNDHDEQLLNQRKDIKENSKDAFENESDTNVTLENNEKKLHTSNDNNTNEIKTRLLAESDSDEAVKNLIQITGTEKHTKDQEKDIVNDIQINSLNSNSMVQSQPIEINQCDHTLVNNCSENIELSANNSSVQSNVKLNQDEKSNSDDQLNIPLSRKRKRKSSIKHRRKHIMESMHAKKMLLTYSSSDTEDEQLTSALKEIKDSLLKEMSSEEENSKKLKVSNKSSTSSESDEDLLRRVKRVKKNKNESITSKEEEHESTNSEKTAQDSKLQSVDSNDENLNSNSSQMGRSRAHPGGSSQNSDSQDLNDKDIDGLTNLKNIAKSRQRRGSATSENTESNSRKSRQMAKAPLINEENMLKPDSSSDGASASGGDSDGGNVDDLPSVALTGLNGSGIDHLAKDDLLEESDTSNSHNEKEESSKKSESEEDHNPKSKRRKANAISSDSEGGSSRKKNPGVKLSDFEDSEEESSEPAKRNKRKKKEERADSDASVASSSDDGSKKKRRRIKQVNDSDASGSDTENEGRNKHGRKNIRKVMGKNQLEEATKKAAREEKERIARIAERQKLYNNLEFDESGKPDEVVLEKVVLDFDPETKEPLIQVDRGLVKKLKPHQANGIKFMWDACFESVKRIKKDRGSGCILAHCMGLGKTLQVVSLTHTLLTHSDLTTVNRVLVVCPLSTVLNWVNEYKMWLKHSEAEYEVDVYELSRFKQNSERAFQLQQWLQHGGVCVLGYEMFRNLSADNSKKFKKKMLKNFQEALVDPGPDLVVCDEGHLLKNEKTSLSQSMNRVRTRRRIVLTGTPLQNNLKEYYCMVQFVKPNLLGKYNEYLNRFVNPITNGQYTDSTEHDIRIMKRRSHVLHKMLDGAVQRRDYGVLAPFLPPKHEYVLFITLTEVQIKLYQFYLDNYSRRPLPGKSSGFLFPDFQSLQRIWTHPLVLKYNSERYEIMQQKKREREEEEDSEGSLIDFIDDDSTPEESTTDESSDDLSDASDDSRKKSKKKKSQKKGKGKESKMAMRRGTRANPVELDEDDANNDVVEIKAENPTEWWIKLVTDEEIDDMRNSHKLVLLFDILRQCEAIGDKLLVFSQSLYSLDLIEHFLGKVDEATQEGRIDEKLAGHVGSWSPGIDYFRLDGSTSCENRSIWCKNFNREDNPRARLFLISTRAGGLGINLVAANRVVIFDVSWNPSHDVQSIFRVYRFGQKKPCYIYRFLAMGTMEEKIYERQVTKQAISKRVIDEQQIDRHYAENDLAELYKFESHPPTPRPLPPLPKDRLFAEMLKEHEAQIYKYHEHDSLLENKEEETLSEEERKAAWEDFENEKNRPPPAPFPSAWPMHNGMVPGLLAQQQQQLAYAALAAMLRKDMPNINDNTIRDMLPHIYNSNPALMQKISELYKFAPGGMMNPAMMNPVMNAGGAGTGALGGASGLQYEPPWQRQHQQQQQMRLQQLMQHQNMGAKYYAGGLGSRDPVAMALQQQRAREIMAGEARARPRGRPPLQPRAPAAHQAPHTHADVVNLDSD